MNKNSKQVEKFLAQYTFKSQIDFEMISSFCLQKLELKIKAPKVLDAINGLDAATFSSWYSKGFAQGDIVRWGDNLAVLHSSSLTGCTISYYINANKELTKSDKISAKIGEIQHVSPEEYQILVHCLLENGLEVSRVCLLVTEKYIPSSNKLVKFWNDKVTGFGVVRDISPEGVVLMYCYITLAGEVHYSMHDTLGKIDDYQFEEMTLGYRRKLERELNKCGKSWNDHRKRIEPVDLRLKTGKNYFYITDLLKVVQTEDNGKATANYRYLCGNYFQSREEAQKCAEEWAEIRRDELAK